MADLMLSVLFWSAVWFVLWALWKMFGPVSKLIARDVREWMRRG